MSNLRKLAEHPARRAEQDKPLDGDAVLFRGDAYVMGVLPDGTIGIDHITPIGILPMRFDSPESAREYVAELQAAIHLARERLKELAGAPRWIVSTCPARADAVQVSYRDSVATFVAGEIDAEGDDTECASCKARLSAGARAWTSTPFDKDGQWTSCGVFVGVYLCDPCATPQPEGLTIGGLLR